MKIIYGEMLLKLRKCVPEKFFRRLEREIWWMIIVDKAVSEVSHSNDVTSRPDEHVRCKDKAINFETIF